MSYEAVVPIGMRCYTEIFLKKMGYKKYSCPFDAIFSNSIDDIIYLFENKIEYDKLIHTENIRNNTISQLNEQYGLRTIHTQLNYYNENDYFNTYHLATFAHHNLNDEKVKQHFERCFNRLEIIKERKIKTLFCLFNHTILNKRLTLEKINKIKTYLCNHYNFHLLVIEFITYNDSAKYNIVYKDNLLTYIYINNNSIEYENQKDVLKYIFDNFVKINPNELLTYEQMT